MRTKQYLATLVLSLLLAISGLSQAGVPQTLSYQGQLTSAAGVPVNNTANITFRLYSALTGGTQLWSETQSVAVNNGLFSVELGKATQFNLAFDAPYFLGIQVGTDAEMQPRQALSSVGTALAAATLYCNGCITAAHLASGVAVSGPTGTTGATGPQGAAGVNGKTILSGSSAPTSGNGVDGDYYIDTSAGLMYGPKTAGAWTVLVSLVSCKPGDQLDCYSGDSTTRNVGACKSGRRSCTATGWGTSCAGEVLPVAETYNGIDDDCNGVVDNGVGCASGYANCDGNYANGCEINLQTNINNCGTCGVSCAVANGASVCTNGSCSLSACNSGYANCDGNAANGCEINLQTNVNNCGTCGFVCPSVANGSSACTAGSCSALSCNSGYANCDNSAANGCEINIQTDINNCGGCGNSVNDFNGCTADSCSNGVAIHQNLQSGYVCVNSAGHLSTCNGAGTCQ
jgi:hypothetical protein